MSKGTLALCVLWIFKRACTAIKRVSDVALCLNLPLVPYTCMLRNSAFTVRLCDKYSFLMNWLILQFVMIWALIFTCLLWTSSKGDEKIESLSDSRKQKIHKYHKNNMKTCHNHSIIWIMWFYHRENESKRCGQNGKCRWPWSGCSWNQGLLCLHWPIVWKLRIITVTTYLICTVPDVVSCPSSSVENDTLKTSWENALDLSTVFSCFQSHRVNM